MGGDCCEIDLVTGDGLEEVKLGVWGIWLLIYVAAQGSWLLLGHCSASRSPPEPCCLRRKCWHLLLRQKACVEDSSTGVGGTKSVWCLTMNVGNMYM